VCEHKEFCGDLTLTFQLSPPVYRKLGGGYVDARHTNILDKSDIVKATVHLHPYA